MKAEIRKMKRQLKQFTGMQQLVISEDLFRGLEGSSANVNINC